jgi:aldehyde dehydrogenase (NAD+)
VIAQVGRLVEANKEALAALVTREVGKPYAEALGEVQEVIDTCDFFLGEGRRLYGPDGAERDARQALFTYRMPVGVAASSRPRTSRWPCRRGTSCRRCCAATPWSGSRRRRVGGGEALHARSCTPGACPRRAAVSRRRPTTYDGLSAALDEGLVDKVGFTGSTEVGRRIGELCGRHLQSPCLELGGKNPLVVMPDADLELAVEGALFGGFGTAGQRCTSVGTVWVHRDVEAAFVERYAAAVERRSSATRASRCCTAR